MNTDLQETNVNEESQAATETSEENQNAEVNDTSGNDTEVKTEAETSSDEAASAEASEESPFLVCRYNKSDVPLTREKAQELAQKGMHYENELNFLAAINGCTPNELLKKARENVNQRERSRLEEEFPDDPDTVDLYMEKFERTNKEKYGRFLENQKTIEEEKEQTRIQKLGDEFIALQKEFPDLKEIKDIPPSVLKDANNMSLEHAYLKHLRKEQLKIEAAKAKQAEAKEQSTGSMSSGIDAEDNLIAAMRKGLAGI